MRYASLARLSGLALLWGSNFFWIKLAGEGFSPVQVTLLRLVLGALVLVAVIRAQDLHLPADLATWRHLTVAAVVGNALPYWLFAVAEQHVSSSLAGALNATTPLWTLGFSLLSQTESRLRPMQVGG